MKKWQFEIIAPKSNYLRGLDAMPSEDISISEHSDDHSWWLFFSSTHLNTINDPNEVFQKAYKFKMLIDGISYLLHENKSSYTPIVLGNLFDENDQRVEYLNQPINPIFDFSFNSLQESGRYKNHPVSILVHHAGSDSFIRDLLIICSQGMDYVALYRLLDQIRTFLQDKGGLDSLGIDKATINRFTHTANNFQTLGIEARHGNLGHQPPRQPMELFDAQNLITNICLVVFKKFYSIDLSIIKDFTATSDDLF